MLISPYSLQCYHSRETSKENCRPNGCFPKSSFEHFAYVLLCCDSDMIEHGITVVWVYIFTQAHTHNFIKKMTKLEQLSGWQYKKGWG